MLLPLIAGLILGGGVCYLSLHFLKQTESRKRVREGEYYRALLEAIPDMIFFLDRDGVFQDYIPAGDETPLVPKEQFLGKSYREVLPPDVAHQFDEPLQDVLHKGEKARVEYQLDATGDLREYEARLIGLGGGRILTLVRDVTERSRAVREVEKRAKELAALHAISVDITAAQELGELLQTSAERTVQLLGGFYGAIFLRGEKEEEFLRQAEYLSESSREAVLYDCGRAVAREVGRTKKPRIISAQELVEKYRVDVTDDQTVILAVPLFWDEDVIGVIHVWNIEPDSDAREEELALLTKLANQIAIAVRNARLLESRDIQLLLSETMHDVGALLTRQAGMEDVLNEVLDLLDRVVSFDSASILLLGEGGTLHLVASRGIDEIEAVRQAIDQKSDYILPQKWIERKTVYVPDTRKSDEWVYIPETSYIRSWIGAVLNVQDEFIGLLNVDNSKVDAYDSTDMRTVRVFADQAAIAIENARLFEEKQVSHHRLQVLYDLNNKLAETLDSRVIIERSTAIARDALEGDVADYYHYHGGHDQVELVSSVGRNQEEIEIIKNSLITLEDTGDLQWVLENQRSVRMSNVLDDERWIVIPNLDNDIRSLITVPVFIDDQLSGAISVLHRQENAFREEHEELLNAISQQTGLALNNAQRYKEVERLLNELEARQEMQSTLFEHLPVGVLLLDDAYRILSSNDLGREHVRALHQGRLPEMIQTLGRRPLSELVRRHRDPRPIEIGGSGGISQIYEAQIRQVAGPGAPYWVLMIDDVTEERDRERRLNIQDRLATIGQFAAGVAHDFNNIVSAILVYTDVLKKDQDLSQENVERISVIQKQTQRATELIGQILDFSRHSIIEHTLFDLVPFIEDIKGLLERVLPEDIQVELDIEDQALPLYIHGDSTRLQQVIMNLASNARDAMPEGGNLHIRLGTLHIPEYQVPPVPSMGPGAWVTLEVEDEGEGIPDDELPHIFEPFFTTKATGEGTGLGLAQVYGIVKQHNGFVDVVSEVGMGTTISIYLPLVKDVEVDRSSFEGELELDGREGLALIVEDDESLRNALWNLFEECNYQVILATNGEQGLDAIRQVGDRIELVVTDLVMPQMGGIAMYKEARKLYPKKMFLFITGHQEASRKVDLLDDPFIRRLQKPFTMQEMIESVKELRGSSLSAIGG